MTRKTQEVLDRGYVKFIDSMGSEEDIVSAARMSTGKGFLGWEPGRRCVKCGLNEQALISSDECNGGQHRWADHKGDANLLEFLYRNAHMTPFEMVELVVEVKAPIFVFREWHRHRTFSFNEFSARYAQMPDEHYVPAPERFLPVYSQNKQESSVGPELQTAPQDLQMELAGEQANIYETYESMLGAGVPKEVARINTPVSRYSRMRAKANLRNWLAFLHLRLAPNAQWEIRQYANAVATIVKAAWPRTWALFEEYTLGAVTLSKSEVAAVRKALLEDVEPGLLAQLGARLK